MYSSFSLDCQPIFGFDAQAWSFIEAARVMRDPGLSFKEKLIMLPSVHESHPLGYPFVLYLYSFFVGFTPALNFLNPMLFILSGFFLYCLLRSLNIGFFFSSTVVLMVFFNPLVFYGTLYLVTEFLAFFLLIILVPVFWVLQGREKMPKKTRYALASFFLLLVLGIAYTKFEYGVIVFLVPFVFTPGFIKKNRLFSFISLSLLLLALMPAVYHTFFYNSNSTFAFYFSFLNIRESLIPFLAPSLFILVFSAFAVFYAVLFRKPWALLPFIFLFLFSSFITSTFENYKYFYSYISFFIFVFLVFCLDLSKGNILNLKKFPKRVFISFFGLLVLVSGLFGFYFYPRIYVHMEVQRDLTQDFMSRAANCSYLESIADLNQAMFALYDFPSSDRISNNLFKVNSPVSCIDRIHSFYSYEFIELNEDHALVLFALKQNYPLISELERNNFSYELVFNESREFFIVKVLGRG